MAQVRDTVDIFQQTDAKGNWMWEHSQLASLLWEAAGGADPSVELNVYKIGD